MNGLLLVNKPLGITSFDVIRVLRRQTGVKKIGHAGTLDPLATGLMLILMGTATKQAQQLTACNKRYKAEITLGKTSTTGDGEGEKRPGSLHQPSPGDVSKALATLTGTITQTPSAYSAIKINGREAYKRVRAGEQVSMPSRQVTIFDNHILHYNYPLLKLDTRVSSGTYIRSLAADLGTALETGAFLSGLIRTEVGEYSLSSAVALENITTATLPQHLRELI